MSGETILATIIGTIAGGLASLAISWLFYYRSGKQLEGEAEKLRRLNTIMLVALQNAGLADLNWKDGEITGLNVKVQARAFGASSAIGFGASVASAQGSAAGKSTAIGQGAAVRETPSGQALHDPGGEQPAE